jgi:CheY-like chemotaxis protein
VFKIDKVSSTFAHISFLKLNPYGWDSPFRDDADDSWALARNRSQADAMGRSMRILAVDDDAAILELLTEGLAVSGHSDVVTAHSGDTAIEILNNSETPFDCFLLDIQMPGMDGVELCAHIRAIEIYRFVPILMVTAMSQKSYIDRAFTAGATDYITKPFDFLEVGTRLSLAQKQVANWPGAVEIKSAELPPVPVDHSLCEPVEILGVDHVVGYVAFDNYVLQLTRGHLFLSAVFALKIAGIEQLYAKSSTAEFRDHLADVAQLIVDRADPVGTLLSYRGNGVFLCISHKGSRQAHLEFENSLHEKAKPLIAILDIVIGQPDFQMIVGEQISLGLMSRSGSLNHMRRAIDKVETKALFLRDMKAALEKEDAHDDRKQEILDKKKSGYEAMLRESLQDAPSLIELRQA